MNFHAPRIYVLHDQSEAAARQPPPDGPVQVVAGRFAPWAGEFIGDFDETADPATEVWRADRNAL
jgi:hypothetical protein